jgi:aryl-alcohol dehydrogenase-like predicted oxidoreductase
MGNAAADLVLPTRGFGRTGARVTCLGLGGEGILRTHDRLPEAAAVITHALECGVRYFDTAPAYASSMDYLGAVLGERRRTLFLASKTAERTRDGSLRVLDDSLRRLRTDHLDLWQLHDLRTMAELDRIFSRSGAIHALDEARSEGRARFLGITGHHDPAVLVEAMRRFDFDSVLVSLNPADVHRRSFIRSVVPEAARRGLAVVGMKAYGAGTLLAPAGPCSPREALSYVLSLPPVSCVVVGCRTSLEVDENSWIASRFRRLPPDRMRMLERRTGEGEAHFTSYKKEGQGRRANPR